MKSNSTREGLSGSRDYGYLGKQFDKQTGLYSYGYRDYAPHSARFTTVDPIRGGSNWFAYLNNDAVNFVDLWGLCQGKGWSEDGKTYTIQEGDTLHQIAAVYRKRTDSNWTYWDIGFHAEDGSADALYSSAGVDIRPNEKQINFFMNLGTARYNFATKGISDSKGKVKFGLSGTLESFTGNAWIGIKDGQFGCSSDAGMLKMTLNLNFSFLDKTLVLGSEFGIGSVAAGTSIGFGGSKEYGNGISFGYTVYIEDNE